MASTEVYESRSIRNRRTAEELNTILQASRKILSEENGCVTIRHLFYRLVGERLLSKSEQEYKHLGSYLMKWRRSGEIPWSAFADNTRWYYGAACFSSMEAALKNTRDTYRRNMWATQPAFVEIWTEKDAIASILLEEANPFGVRVFPLRGFPSGSALHNAAVGFKAQIWAGKDVFIYYFGDHDPSGLEIDQSVVRNLKKDHEIDISFERIAVTHGHIEQYGLPTRPSKPTDSRTKKFKGESVEIDAMPMDALRGMVNECIFRHINVREWKAQKEIELQEKHTLRQFTNVFAETAVS